MKTDEEISTMTKNILKMIPPRMLKTITTIEREYDAALLRNRKKLIACINHMAQANGQPESKDQ